MDDPSGGEPSAPRPGLLRSIGARLAGLTTRHWDVTWRLVASLMFRWACVSVMIRLTLWAERQPGPTVPDVVIDRVPYVPWMYNINYLVWIVGVAPVSLALLFSDPRRYARYSVTDGILAVTRGLCVAATSLGPVSGLDHLAARTVAPATNGLTRMASPVNGMLQDERHLFLTRDLFFSGHTATTFLLLLYVMNWARLRWWMGLAHVAVVITLVFGHMHYTIDIIGAWAVTLSLFWLREGDVRSFLRSGEMRARP